MTNPMAIEERGKMLTGKAEELVCRRLDGIEPELVEWGKSEGVIDLGETTEIWVRTVVEIKLVRKSETRKGNITSNHLPTERACSKVRF